MVSKDSQASPSDNSESVEYSVNVARRDLFNATLVAGAAALLPGVALGSSAGKSESELTRPNGLMSWPQYVDLLRSYGDLARITLEPASDQVRGELYRQLAMNLASGYFVYFQSDARYPDWMPMVNSVFTLQPNPDDAYWLAPLDDKGSYRIVGTRGSVHIVSFVLTPYVMGASDRLEDILIKEAESLGQEQLQDSNAPVNSGGYYDIDDLGLGPNGEFEVLLSAQRPPDYTGDWWELPAGVTSLMVRQRSYNWGVEQDARFAIERLDGFSAAGQLKPRMTAEEIDRQLRLLFGGYVGRLSRMWLKYQKVVYDRGIVNKLVFANMAGSAPAQVYWEGMYEFGAEDALILETDIPKKLRYWNVQLNDALWNATEFVYRQSSLNGHQAQLDSDGKFRAVISLRDPGIWNWLDPAGYQQGMLIGRWYEADAHPLPTLKRVPFERIHEYLLPDTPRVTEAERTEQLRKRHIGGQLRRRW